MYVHTPCQKTKILHMWHDIYLMINATLLSMIQFFYSSHPYHIQSIYVTCLNSISFGIRRPQILIDLNIQQRVGFDIINLKKSLSHTINDHGKTKAISQSFHYPRKRQLPINLHKNDV